jgi:NADPH:quinone reductase-like Zn-dependent oxidoreductase
MKKVLVRRPGNFERLELVEQADPRPGAGEALVRTVSIGVNFADCVVRMGLYPSAKEYVGWPITPGFEFSGIVESLGDGENPAGLKVGEAVLGVVRFGAYATHVVAPLHQLFRAPPGVGLVQAGAIPVAALTALYGVSLQGAASAGDKVLIHSAAGGVGSHMVAIAKLLGCYVVGVVGAPHKCAVVQELGADAVIDKSQEDLFSRARELCPGGYDIVLDANGVQTLRGSYQALRPTGRLVTYGAHTMLTRGSGRANWLKLGWDFLRTPRFDPLRLTNENKNIMAFNLSYLFEEQELLQESFGRILRWYESGELKPAPLRTIAFEEVGAAHAALQSGTTVGKLTLVTDAAESRST